MSESNRAIEKIKCLNCGNLMNIISEVKDNYNSDFYISIWRCEKCDKSIKITTQEWRD